MTTSAQAKAPAGDAKAGTATDPAAAKSRQEGKTSPGNPATPAGKGSAARTATPPRRRRSLIAWLALLIALGAGAAAYYIWQIQQADRAQFATALDTMETRSAALSGETRATVPALENRLNEEQARVQAIATQLGDVQQAQQQINDAIGTLHAAVNRDRANGWLVAEAEYLVRIAGERLKLTADVDTAVAALLAADERLKGTGDPSLITARSAIADDINALQSVTVPDITGMALSLGSLQHRIADLSLAGTEPGTAPVADSAAPASEGWQAAADAAWAAIRNLVVVTHESDSSNSPLLSPDQREFLRQNLGLKLETARLALLQRDTDTFHDSLKSTRAWITTYFRDGTARTNLLDSLALLDGVDLNPDFPEVSASLQALRSWSNRRGGDTARAPAPDTVTVARQGTGDAAP
jgi:uroporphyrin-3 C-methyltransferase